MTISAAGAPGEAGVYRLTLDDVRDALAGPLPGVAAQAVMAPQARPTWPAGGPPPNCREGGVLLLLFPRGGELHFLLTRRSEDLAAHRGQVSLPGGGRHPGETLARTALRETGEELGIDIDAVQLIGRLSALDVPVSNYRVFPVVGYVTPAPAVQPNPKEVAGVLEVPLAGLLDAGSRQVQYWDEPDFGGGRRIPCFVWAGWRVWGATAMILSEMAVLLEKAARDQDFC